MKPISSSKFIFPFLLFSLAITAMGLMDKATPAGAGLANDSAAYIAGARSILQGTGYSDIWLDSTLEPITHYPPLLSITLSAIGLAGIDPLRSVRVVNILLFGFNTLLVALLGYKLTRSKSISVWVGTVFLLNSSLLRVSLFAMSEPLFLFLSLTAFLFFFLALEQPERFIWLPLAGCCIGLAILTRYSGIALIPTFGLMILLTPLEIKQKIKNLIGYLVPVVLLVSVWFVRNKFVATSITNRSIQFHPITMEQISPAIFNLARIFLPLEAIREPLFKSGLWTVLLGMVLVGLAGYSFRLIKQVLTQASNTVQTSAISSLLVFFLAYLGAVFFSISFFDNSTKFQDRILAPAVVVFFLFSAYLLQKIINYSEKTKFSTLTKGLISGCMISAIVLSLAGEMNAMKLFSTEGQGYASWKYQDSIIMAELEKLPDGIAIYTNTPPAVYLVTSRSAKVLPTPIDPVSDTPRLGYDQDIEEMIAKINSGEAVLALFNTNDLEDSNEADTYDALKLRLNSLIKTGDAELFGVSLP